MPEVESATGEIYVSNHTFYLLGIGGDSNFPDPADEGELMNTGLNGVTVTSALDDHDVAFRLERWDSEPPPQSAGHGAAWEIADQRPIEFDADQERFTPWEIFGEAVGDGVALPGPGTYHIRIYSRGRAAAIAQFRETLSPPTGLEEYLIQIWPAETM